VGWLDHTTSIVETDEEEVQGDRTGKRYKGEGTRLPDCSQINGNIQGHPIKSVARSRFTTKLGRGE